MPDGYSVAEQYVAPAVDPMKARTILIVAREPLLFASFGTFDLATAAIPMLRFDREMEA